MTQSAEKMIDDEQIAAIAQVLKAMGDSSRLRILRELMGAELCVGEIAERTNLSQANTSKHLSQLRREGLVQYSREGNSKRFRVGNALVPKLCELLCNFQDHELL